MTLLTWLGRIACLAGFHDDATETRRLGFVRIALCRRPGCERYTVRKGWR
ncbi:MAG: hypothetical protein V4515_12290 [Chloroflexota bacterium]